MAFENLTLDRDGAVAILTINRPKVLNALNTPTMDELRRAVLEVKHDASARVLIVRSSRERPLMQVSSTAGAFSHCSLLRTPACRSLLLILPRRLRRGAGLR